MKKGLELINKIKLQSIEKTFDRLFKIPRSITGKGYLKSLKILGEIMDLNLIKVKSNTKVLDWTVPDEWNIYDAYILDSNGKKS